MKARGRAILVGQFGGGRASEQRDPPALMREPLHRQSYGRIGQVGDGGDIVAIKPCAGNGGGDIGLVLMVGIDHLDAPAEHGSTHILDRHTRGQYSGRPAEIAIKPGLVIQHPDADRPLLRAPGRWERGKSGCCCRAKQRTT